MMCDSLYGATIYVIYHAPRKIKRLNCFTFKTWILKFLQGRAREIIEIQLPNVPVHFSFKLPH